MPPPFGIELLKGKQSKYKIGKKIGSGACASVHELNDIYGQATEWVIKLAPLAKKTTKKKNSEAEKHERLIYFEQLVYTSQFPSLQGTIIPKLPTSKGPPVYGEAMGYRYLVLERMDCQLTDVPAMLLKQKGKSISYGPIAVQLLKCVRAIQECNHVVIDMKPENFMLTAGSGKGSSLSHKIASRLRILDLALVQQWKSIGSHRTNEGAGGHAGTPLYSSLNVHHGETPSRRDDLEALGYIMAEMIIQIVSGDVSKTLPWSHGRSDEHIGELKQQYVEDTNSEFYEQLGGASVRTTFKKYMDEVRGYSFKKTPDYDSLEAILKDWKLPSPESSRKKTGTSAGLARATASEPVARSTRRSAKRRTRSQRDESDGEEDSPKKAAKDENYMEPDFIEVDEEDEVEDHDASFDTAQMDWEVTPDENEEPGRDVKNKALVGVTILVETGPHQGETVNLIQGQQERCFVGSNPSGSSGEILLSLSNDSEVDASHLRLDLGVTKKLVSVLVTDLKSSGAYVGSEKIRQGKDYRIYRGGSVRIGNSMLVIKSLDPNSDVTAGRRAKNTPKANASRTSRRTAVPRENPSSAPEIPSLERRGVQLVVVEGPHRGDSFELEHGGIESYNVGSKPSSRTGEMMRLRKDTTLKTNHVRLDLNFSKSLTTVTVIDKSKGETYVNRNKVNKGRAFINDRIRIGNSVVEILPL